VQFKRSILITLFVIISIFALAGCQKNVVDEEEKVIEKTPEEIRLEEESNARLSERIAMEGRRILLEVERLKEKAIREKTYYIGSKNATVYDSFGPEKSSLRELVKADSVLVEENNLVDEAGKAYAKIADASVESGYSYVLAKNLIKDKTDLIYKKYDGAVYTAVEKDIDFPNNPRIVNRGIYISSHTAKSSKNMTRLKDFCKRNGLNTLVIDVKDDNGNILFYSEAADKYCPAGNGKSQIKDIEKYVQELKDEGFYLIARVVTFKSPKYSKKHPEKSILNKNTGGLYSDGDRITWGTPYDRELWQYNLDVALEAAKVGFNEVQFDYVRFPDIPRGVAVDFRNEQDETKAAVIQKFLIEARRILNEQEVYVSADIFGWSATALSDVGIGQHWEALSNVVDVVSPMIYPSHYGRGNFGFSVPDANPYGTINGAIKDSLRRDKHIYTPADNRPWIQDFTAKWVKGYIVYGEAEMIAQVKALKDNGIEEFLLWNSANRYTEVNYSEIK
jgi:hypothetical protein